MLQSHVMCVGQPLSAPVKIDVGPSGCVTGSSCSLVRAGGLRLVLHMQCHGGSRIQQWVYATQEQK